MRVVILLSLIWCVAGAASAQSSQSSTAVRRTIATAPPQEDNPAGDASQPDNASEAQVRALIDNYRRSWDHMNDRTRKLMLSHGGQTPDQFEHTVRQRMVGQPLAGFPNPGTPVPAAKSTGSSSTQLNLDVLNTMASSTEDLSAIRDGNVKRVQTGGCAQPINARIADLKGRLAMYEHVLHPEAAAEIATPQAPGKPVSHPSKSATVLANDWFTNRAAAPPLTPASDTAKRQLDSVLGDAAPDPQVLKAAAPNSADAAGQRKEAEIEIARIKPELERLSAACAAAH